MKNCSCPVCYEHQSANEYYRMTVHTNEYHKLIEKIHEKIEQVEKLQEYRKQEWNEIDFTNDQIIKELKSLLENKK